MTRLFAILAVLALAAPAAAQAPRDLDWNEMMPPGEVEELQRQRMAQMLEMMGSGNTTPMLGHSPYDEPQLSMADLQVGTFNVVEALDGARVRLGGYVVPLDFAAGRVSRFLLVPYFGACIHVPPPPPNQMVYVESSEAFELPSLSAAMRVEGVLRAERHYGDLGAAAYTMTLERIERIR
ncbi:MAG: DUF3299 domain-containing protein [Maricaulaceae bacterium]|nr:DUF3299 domain-containing protein [Maricaulaceae bacterium]